MIATNSNSGPAPVPRRRFVRILKWMGVFVVLTSCVIFIFFCVKGLPRPSSISARHVPRVTWNSALAAVAAIREVGGGLDSDGWLTDSSKLWIGTGRRTNEKRAQYAQPGRAGEPILAIPNSATQIIGSLDTFHPIVAYLLDDGGSELYRLYSWVPGAPPKALTATPERLQLCCINSTGSAVAFTRNSNETGLSDVLIADPRDTATVRVIMSGLQGDAIPVEWSPDGQQLLIIQALSFNSGHAFLFDATNNQVTQIVSQWGDSVNIAGGAWSQNGQALYLISDAGSDYIRPFEIELESNTIKPLVTDEGHDAIEIQRVQGTARLVVSYDERGETKLFQIDPALNVIKRVHGPEGTLRTFKMHPQAPKLVEVVRRPDGRALAAVVDLEKNAWEQWALGEPPGLRPAPGGESLTYSTFDQLNDKPRPVNVVFKSPLPKFAAPWPVLIYIHGGPGQESIPGWDPVDALFQRMGIAVLKPNVRGSSGSGRAFQSLDDQEKREDAVRDIGALLDWIKTRPELDASRIAVMGASYGGYMSLASLIHYSARLRCGIDMFGITDFPDFIKASEQNMYVDLQRREYGDERNYATREFLQEISPINHADRVTVPIFIYQGANDQRVKPEQSRAMVAKLEQLGRDVSYAEAANEGHALNDPLNQLYVGSAFTDFLQRCLIAADPSRQR